MTWLWTTFLNIPTKYITVTFGDLEYSGGQIESSSSQVDGRRQCET
jgi:hypothetical protein